MHQNPRILVPIENNNIAPLIINCTYRGSTDDWAGNLAWRNINSQILDYLTEFHKSQNEVYFIYVVHTAASTETENGKPNITRSLSHKLCSIDYVNIIVLSPRIRTQ